MTDEQPQEQRSCPTRRPARSWSRRSASSRPGGTTLEESLALWERGEHLATVCQQWLDGVRERLDETLGATRATEPDQRLRGVGVAVVAEAPLATGSSVSSPIRSSWSAADAEP